MTPKTITAEFIISNSDYTKCPKPSLPEYAFIGRSNVGKSSLINMLTGQQNLAKVSGKPGKTQLINHFLIDKQWYLVDLPGYGYAKASKQSREKWEKFIADYILNRTNLYCLFVLIDARHEPQKIDVEFMRWLGEKEVPFAIVFTKADKLGKVAVITKTQKYCNQLLSDWDSLPETFLTSAETKQGRDDILNYIGTINTQAGQPIE